MTEPFFIIYDTQLIYSTTIIGNLHIIIQILQFEKIVKKNQKNSIVKEI